MFTKVLRSFGMRGRVLTLDAPISGDVIPLSEVNDQTFATGLLGQGVAIRPTGTRVIAPADAKIEAIFPTGHAVALNTVDGLDVLIHVGLDTVQLEGKHFTVHAQVGDIVHKGDVLIEFEREAIEAELSPEAFTGRSAEQVTEFLRDVIQPVLDANAEDVGQHVELNV